jgi:hypothetical protein
MGRYKLDWSGLGSRHMAVSNECSKEPSGYMKCGAFLDEMRAF